MNGQLNFCAQTINENKNKIQSTMINGRYVKPQENVAIVSNEWHPDKPATPRSARYAKATDNNGSPVHCHDELAWDEEDVQLIPRIRRDGYAI